MIIFPLEGKIKILNSELIKNSLKEKGKRVDVLIEVDNVLYNLEMNAGYNYRGLIERNTAYICRVYSEHQITKDTYVETKKCIQINFNNFKVNKSNKLKEVYKVRNDKNDKLTKNIEIHHINIENEGGIWYNEFTEDKLHKWIKVIRSENMEELERNVEFMGEIGKELLNEVDRLSSDEMIIGVYDGEVHDRKVKEEIRREGIEDGSKKANINNAKKMLDKNCDVKFISEITGLSIKFINKLKVSSV